MLYRLHVQNFTVFRQADFQFSPGMNVIVGDNGTGKTHLLKLGYMLCRAWNDIVDTGKELHIRRVESYFEERMEKIFRASNITDLIRQETATGSSIFADVTGYPASPPSASWPSGMQENRPWKIHIKRQTNDQPAHIELTDFSTTHATNAFIPLPIFVPSKEIVSLFKGLIGLFETYRDVPLDETYRDLAVVLATLEPREPAHLLSTKLSQHIQQLLGGNLKLENNELVFIQTNGRRLESQLMAEGHRKLALLMYLVRNNLIKWGSTVFWDEPEANLNPSSMRLLAEALHVLASEGVQIIVATHSLFFLRELEILLEQKSSATVEARFFGLHQTNNGVNVEQGEHLYEIGDITALEESLKQSDRYLESGDWDEPVAD